MKTTSNISQLRRISWVILFSIIFPAVLSAASLGSVKGRIVDRKRQPVEFATAALLRANDKSLVKGSVSNRSGEFVIEKVVPGTYIVTVTMLGYNKAETEKFEVGSNAKVERTIVLNESTLQLKETTVVAKRKFIEQQADKMVINPEASITTSSENVYEILKKLPGVSVDNNDNISLKGKQGVKVMIDDKPTYLSADQLANLLKGIQGKNVDKIEIIENPSARYDAEGNSGIINIKTKHNKAPGFNGSVSTGFNIGKRLGEYATIDMNANSGKLNLYGNYSFYDWRGWHTLDGTRRFTSSALAGAYQKIYSKQNNDGNAHNFKVGADYYIAKNHVVSVMFRGSNGHNLSKGSSQTSFSDRNQNIDSTIITQMIQENSWRNYTYNASYKWDIDSTGRSMTVDADYAKFFFKSINDQSSSYYDNAGKDLNRDFGLLGIQNGNIDIFTVKVDYVHPLNKKITIESGLKTSFVTNDGKSDFEIDDQTGTVWNNDLSKHDHFIYDENINAAYVSGRGKFGKTSLQLGLRVENTNSRGNSLSMSRIDESHYTNLFPSLFIQQKLNENNQLGFSYSYRIGRPSYHILNPFVWILDPYTYMKGNPFLQPQFTHSMSMNHSYKGKFITTVGYNYTRDIFTEVIQQNDETKVIYQTNENLSNAIDMNASETAQLELTKWWRINATITGMFKKVTSDFAGATKFQRWSYRGNMTNSFTLPKDFGIELSGRYQSKQLWGNFYIYESYLVDLGVQKKVLNNKGTLKISVNDLFNTNRGGGYTKYANVDLNVMNHWDSRRLNISFNYRFGKDTFRTRANRSTASSEEESRSAKQ